WGVFAHTQVNCLIVHPAPEPRMESATFVTGYIGLQQLRRNVRLRVLSHVRLNRDLVQGGAGGAAGIALRTDAPPSGPVPADIAQIGLLEDYCTRPLPSF